MKRISMVVLTVLFAIGVYSGSAVAVGSNDYPFREDEWCAQWEDSQCVSQTTDGWGFFKRECTSFVAWRMRNDNGFADFKNTMVGPNGAKKTLGNASNWGDAASAMGYVVDMNPVPGSVAWWSSGHVAWVLGVSGSEVTIEEYNFGYTHEYMSPLRKIAANSVSGYIHFKDLDGAPSSSNNTTLALKKLTQSDGTNVVYWAKGTDVFETWWRPGGDGLHHSSIIHIEQGDIVDIDAQIHADGLHQVYTATKRFVWETWWYPGQPLHWSAIVQSPHEIKAIQKTVDASGTHQLYAMTSAGVDEYWWRIGGDGVHGSRIFSLNDPVSIKKHFEPDGRQVIYVADRAYVYEVWWRPGVPGITIGTIIHIAQADIVDIDLSTHQGNLHRLYTGTANSGVWEAKWTPGLAGISYRRITGGTGVVAIQKWMDGETHNLYVATNGGVFEYWWLSAETNTHASTILNNIADVRDFERTTSSDGAQAVYTIANTRVYESWWVPGGSGIHSKPIA